MVLISIKQPFLILFPKILMAFSKLTQNGTVKGISIRQCKVLWWLIWMETAARQRYLTLNTLTTCNFKTCQFTLNAKLTCMIYKLSKVTLKVSIMIQIERNWKWYSKTIIKPSDLGSEHVVDLIYMILSSAKFQKISLWYWLLSKMEHMPTSSIKQFNH